ncbi:hypothetical protein [Flaviaesturariibacter amylovorans]|uniref:Uncharacterized protein n=1 Tax=Flaviaesturariibacter amylovorans TaxID=1084520 RepID=A0ABP8H4W4_9BACT
MRKLAARDLIEFRRKASDRSRKAFVDKLKSPVIKPPDEGGGDYWISGLSAIRKSYASDEIAFADEKIDDLRDKIAGTRHSTTRSMYNQNISILESFKGIAKELPRPALNLTFLKKASSKSLLSLSGFQLESKPCHVFTFGKKGEEAIGAVCFVAKMRGYTQAEIVLICELTHRFLTHNYSSRYPIDPKYCFVVDTINKTSVHYGMIGASGCRRELQQTLRELKRFL